MIDLIGKSLQDTICIGGEFFFIHTDFRIWMRFCNDFENWDRKSDMNIEYLFASDVPDIQTGEDMNALLQFAYPPAVVPKPDGDAAGRILDYEIDADYIYSAFLGQYGVDLMESDLHWHTFHALLRGLNASTKLHEVMGYRCYEGKEKDYIKLRKAWELPVKLTAEEMDAKEEFNEYFG